MISRTTDNRTRTQRGHSLINLYYLLAFLLGTIFTKILYKIPMYKYKFSISNNFPYLQINRSSYRLCDNQPSKLFFPNILLSPWNYSKQNHRHLYHVHTPPLLYSSYRITINNTKPPPLFYSLLLPLSSPRPRAAKRPYSCTRRRASCTWG